MAKKYPNACVCAIFVVSLHSKQQSQVISLKCQPERIDELKVQYDCVGNPYNESPKYWIGLDPHTSPDELARDLIRNSYEVVKAKYSKKMTEREKMLSGEVYGAYDAELLENINRVKVLCQQYNK